METLKHNIVKIYGKCGESWLAELSRRTKQLQHSWGLSELKPFPNLSYSYVLAGLQGNIPMDKEAKALNAFKGFGAVSVLGREEGILLLERAVPGNLLKKSFPKEKRIEIACKVIDKHASCAHSIKGRFSCNEEWLAAVDREWDLPKDHLKRARKLKNKLIKKDSGRKVLLHGDLHQENILSNGNDWVVIDPKGVTV